LVDRVFLILPLIALAACDSPRRGSTVRVAGCVEGRVIGCVCSDGRSGSQVCLADDQFSACECTGPIADAGGGDDAGEEDGSLDKDSGSGDGGFADAASREDAGFEDGGFDGGIGDTGAGDADSGGFDGGFDAGFDGGFDAGFDSGAQDTGFPDASPFPDGGLPDFDAGTGGPCSSDLDCNQGSGFPIPVYICEQSTCELGCLYYELFGTPICVSPQVCDFTTGRCL
jgi:hypothetical protein